MYFFLNFKTVNISILNMNTAKKRQLSRIGNAWDFHERGGRLESYDYVIYKTAIFPQVFEEDALQWEEKLNRIHDVFDVWIDVQRRWVYLDGIFSGSADIKALLPVETQRFQRWVFLFYEIGMNVIATS